MTEKGLVDNVGITGAVVLFEELYVSVIESNCVRSPLKLYLSLMRSGGLMESINYDSCLI